MTVENHRAGGVIMKDKNTVSLRGKGLGINKVGKAIICRVAEPQEYKIF